MSNNTENVIQLSCPHGCGHLEKGNENWFCPKCKCIIYFNKETSLPPELNEYPSIIAIPLKDYYIETNAVLKLWHICDTVEFILRLFVSIGLSELIDINGKLSEKVLSSLNTKIETPTLDKWLKMALDIVSEIPDASCVKPYAKFVKEKLSPFLNVPKSKKKSTGNQKYNFENSFSILRNRLAHGGSIKRDFALDYLGKWSPLFENLFKNCDWIVKFKLVAKSDNGAFIVMCGPDKNYSVLKIDSEQLKSLSEKYLRDEEILAVIGDKILPLWPLAIYGIPKSMNPDYKSIFGKAAQAYIRRDDLYLEFTPIDSDEVCQSISGQEALNVFLKLFKSDCPERVNEKYEVPDFDKDIKTEARNFIGRKTELETINSTILSTTKGVIWLSGRAGMGKSYLIAKAASELIDDHSNGLIVLFYRFNAGDERCSRHKFMRFAIERLKKYINKYSDNENTDQNKQNKNVKLDRELEEIFKKINKRKVVFFVDGLDEIMKYDKEFASDFPLDPKFYGVLWVCSGRSDQSTESLFTKDKCKILFPCGLPNMNPDDIRAMIIERVNNKKIRNKIIENEIEKNGKATNEFIEKVSKCADGLPLYVNYLIDDILRNKFRTLDAGELIPESLNKYYEELLKRFDISTLNMIASPTVSLLAIAHEPLNIEIISEILINFMPILAHQKAYDLVSETLPYIQSMIKLAPSPDGKEGYILYHTSLREHIQKSPALIDTVNMLRETLCQMSLKKELRKSKSGRYLLTWGIHHLIDSEKFEEVENLLTDLEHIEAKCSSGMTYELMADYDMALTSILRTGELMEIDNGYKEKVWKYTEELIKYATYPENNLLPQIESVEIMTREEIIEKIRQKYDQKPLSKFEKLEAFSKFVKASSHEFLKHAPSLNGFCIQQAYNSSENGIVAQSAEAFIDKNKDIPLLLLKKVMKPIDNPYPALLKTLEGHEHWVRAIAITSDGKTVVSGSYDKTLRVWDVKSGKCIHVLKGHTDGINLLSITPDGKRVISGSLDNTLKIWNIENGKFEFMLEGHNGTINALAITPDGNRAVTATGVTLRVWDLKNEGSINPLKEFVFNGVKFNETINAIAITPDCKKAVFAINIYSFMVIDLTDGKCLLSDISDSCIHGVAITPDGKYAVYSSTDILKKWDLSSNECSIVIKENTREIAVTSDGKIALAASQNLILKVIDLRTGDCLKILEGHTSSINAIAITPDGKIAATGSQDMTIRIWDVERGISLKDNKEHTLPIKSIATVPDNTKAITGTENFLPIKVWDLTTGKSIQTIKGYVNVYGKLLLTPDGGAVIANGINDKPVKVWGKELLNIPEDRLAIELKRSHEETINVWNVSNGEILQTLKGHLNPYISYAITQDGQMAVTASLEDNIIRMWDMTVGECLRNLEGHDDGVINLTFTPDGKAVVSISRDKTLRVWDIITGECLIVNEFEKCDSSPLIVSPDGKVVITIEKKIISRSDSTITTSESLYILDIVNNKQLNAYENHSGAKAYAISPDGKTVICWFYGDNLRIINIEDGKCLKEYKTNFGPLQYMDIEISTDGRFAIISNDCALNIFELSSGKLIGIIACPSPISSFKIIKSGFVIGEKSGNFNIVESKNFDVCSGPPILTAWHNDKDGTNAFGCFHCRKWSEISSNAIGTEVCCHNCNQLVKLNSFITNGDWKKVEEAWSHKINHQV